MTNTLSSAKRFRIVRILAFSAALVGFCVLSNAPAASADTITYSVTGVGAFSGTSFTVTTNAYLTAPFDVPADPGGTVVDGGTNEGTLDDVIGYTTMIELVTADNSALDFACCGTQEYPTFPVTDYAINDNDGPDGGNIQVGTVTVTDVATPEPGVGGLMLIGLVSLGLVVVMRRRAAAGLPESA
jgi:hypothetical protein